MKGLLRGPILCLHLKVEEQPGWIFVEATRAPLPTPVSLDLPAPAPPKLVHQPSDCPSFHGAWSGGLDVQRSPFLQNNAAPWSPAQLGLRPPVKQPGGQETRRLPSQEDVLPSQEGDLPSQEGVRARFPYCSLLFFGERSWSRAGNQEFQLQGLCSHASWRPARLSPDS